MGEWSIGKWFIKVFGENKEEGGIIFYRERRLPKDKARKIISDNPYIIPFIKSSICHVFSPKDLRFLRRLADLVVVERISNSLKIYLIYFTWYSLGSRIRKLYESPAEAYWSIGTRIENIDEIAWNLSYKLLDSHSKSIIEFKDRIRQALGLRRVRIYGIEAIIVVDEISTDFKELIDAVNEITDTLISALEIKAYCVSNDDCIYISRGYTW